MEKDKYYFVQFIQHDADSLYTLENILDIISTLTQCINARLSEGKTLKRFIGVDFDEDKLTVSARLV